MLRTSLEGAPAKVARRLRRIRDRAATAAVDSAVLPVLRRRATARLAQLTEGVTIVTVNWNSEPYLDFLISAVRARSPKETRIIVMDNASRDGSRRLLRRRADEITAVSLPANIGHERALDIGFLLVGTTYAIALDVDAFPITDDWVNRVLEPLRNGAEVSGARLNRSYVHPCCLAMRTRRFVERGHTFRSDYVPRTEESDASGDVGESISEREDGHLAFFEPTEQRGPGDVGTVFGGIVYHNFYSTRFGATSASVLDDAVTRADPEAAWAEAVARYAVEAPTRAMT